MRGPSVLAVWLVVVLSAGCFGGSEPRDRAETPAPAADPPPVIPGVWFLTENLTLSADEPQGERPGARVPLAWSYAEYYTGAPPPVWQGPPAEGPVRILSARAEVYFSARQEAIDPGQRPTLVAWFGAGDSVVAHAEATGPQVIARDEVVNVSFEFVLPAGGLVVEPGESFELHLGSFYADAGVMTAGRRVQVIVGSLLTPSHLAIVAEPVSLASASERALSEETGSLRGDACSTTPLPAAAESEATFPVVVPASASGVRLRLVAERLAGSFDVDVELRGADDAVFAAGVSPGGSEALDLFATNLAAAPSGSWTARVSACGEQASDFTLTVIVLQPLRAEEADASTPA